MNNTPVMKIGIVAVSRDCFPESLSVTRRQNLVKAYEAKYGKGDIYECPVCIVESEIHMMQALEDIKNAGCNALCVYLGNFGPEIAETMLAKNFNGPKMFIAAAEETSANGGLVQGRGDAYCGMLNASYNLKLRGVKAYIPEYPVGTAEECADMIHEFIPVAKAVYALSNLKIISFGPRPNNFLACNAPIAGLYNLGVEIEENSELDLFESFNKHAGDERIPDVVRDMEKELGTGNKKPEILSRLAQYELTLTDWVESHKGSRKYVAVAGKCWPAFQTQFGCVPCYVNSRLTSRGIPVSCEVDIYGALSEFIGEVVSDDIVTLLDINNTVPSDIYNEDIKGRFNYTIKDTFSPKQGSIYTLGSLTLNKNASLMGTYDCLVQGQCIFRQDALVYLGHDFTCTANSFNLNISSIKGDTSYAGFDSRGTSSQDGNTSFPVLLYADNNINIYTTVDIRLTYLVANKGDVNLFNVYSNTENAAYNAKQLPNAICSYQGDINYFAGYGKLGALFYAPNGNLDFDGWYQEIWGCGIANTIEDNAYYFNLHRFENWRTIDLHLAESGSIFLVSEDEYNRAKEDLFNYDLDDSGTDMATGGSSVFFPRDVLDNIPGENY